jgi:hypothetical protein
LVLSSGNVEEYERVKHNARLIIFILSEAFFRSSEHRFMLDHTCPEDYRKMVFILLDPISSCHPNWMGISMATKKSIIHGRKIKWTLSNTSNIDWKQRKAVEFMKRLRICMPVPYHPLKNVPRTSIASLYSWGSKESSELKNGANIPNVESRATIRGSHNKDPLLLMV